MRNTEEGRSFLSWWDERVTRTAARTHGWTSFPISVGWTSSRAVPRRIVDRNPSLNVAPWNVRGRELRVVGGQYRVGNAPLSFFHYHRVRLGMDVDLYLAEVDHHPVVCELVERYLEKTKRHAPVGPVETSRHDRQADGRSFRRSSTTRYAIPSRKDYCRSKCATSAISLTEHLRRSALSMSGCARCES